MATRQEIEAHNRLLALADGRTPSIRRKVRKALDSIRKEIPLGQLERALRHDPRAVDDLVNALPSRLRPVTRELEQLFLDAGSAARGQLNAQLRTLAQRPIQRIGFDVTDTFMVNEARTSTALLVRQVTDETRRALQTVMSRSFAEGIAPIDTAKLIRPLIGLTERQAEAVMNRLDVWEQDGMSVAELERRSTAYATELRDARALLIARTETIRAATNGTMASWQDAAAKGMIHPSRARKIWLVTYDDKTCPICEALDEVEIPLDATFDVDGKQVQGPPAHPACRCAISLNPGGIPGAQVDTGEEDEDEQPASPPDTDVEQESFDFGGTPAAPEEPNADELAERDRIQTEQEELQRTVEQAIAEARERMDLREASINPQLPEELRERYFFELDTSGITSEERLGGGINDSYKLTIEGDRQVVFKADDSANWAGRRTLVPDDALPSVREVTAYDIDQALGLGIVPETIARQGPDVAGWGSAQRFVPDTVSWGRAPMSIDINRDDYWRLAVLDLMTGNTDRHPGNLLVGQTTGRLVAIDNGLTFPVSNREFRFFMGEEVGKPSGDVLRSVREKFIQTDWETFSERFGENTGNAFMERVRRVRVALDNNSIHRLLEDRIENGMQW